MNEPVIVTPRVVLATGNNIKFKIIDVEEEDDENGEKELHPHAFDWKTVGLTVPVVANENSFPFRVASKTFEEIPKSITLVLAKEYSVPILTMTVDNFGSLPTLFSHGVLNVVVSGDFADYTIDHKIKSIFLKPPHHKKVMADVIVVDKFLERFADDVGVGEHTGQFKIEMFWKISFFDAKLKYIETVLSSIIDMQHVEGTISLLSNTGNVMKVSKGLLAASSPKFKAQFEQDHVNELTFTIDGQVPISEGSLKALMQFITSYSVEQPLAKCSIALELLMASQYHIFGAMKTVMQDILLSQPPEWFDVETSIKLFTFASVVCSSCGTATEDDGWRNLKWKALRNMNRIFYSFCGPSSVSMQELQRCEAITLDPIGQEMLRMLLSLA